MKSLYQNQNQFSASNYQNNDMQQWRHQLWGTGARAPPRIFLTIIFCGKKISF